VVSRHRGGLFVTLVAAPLALSALTNGSSDWPNMATWVGLPLYGDGTIPMWLVVSLYVPVITGPLLSWSYAGFEVGASRFQRTSFCLPHLLSSCAVLMTLVATSSGQSPAAAVFWITSSMAAANLWALVLRRQAWLGMVLSALLVLSLILQGRVSIWHGSREAWSATVAWTVLAVVNVARQRRDLARP
jgi:hypothetical protein